MTTPPTTTRPTGPDPAPTPPRWEQRFSAPRVSVPDWAADAPAACVLLSNETGTFEVHAWDLDASGSSAGGTPDGSAAGFRQVTDRPNGTVGAAVSRDGAWIWWFADTDGDEHGTWQRQPFAGGPDTAAVPDLPAAYSAGLAFGPAGQVVVGSSDDAYGTRVHLVRQDSGGSAPGGAGPGAPELVYEHGESADVGALSHDGTLLAIDHAEHGDARHPAIRVLRLPAGGAAADGAAGCAGAVGVGAAATVGELWDGPGHSVGAIDFAPLTGDTRLLVQHERHGRPELLVWDLAAGTQRELAIDLPGELSADWLPDGTGLVVRSEHAARSTLHRYDLDTATLTALPTPTGSVGSFGVRPDGAVWFGWSSAAEPPVVLSLDTGGADARTAGGYAAPTVVLTAPGPAAPPSVPAEDVWVDGPGGRIHALLRRPRGADGSPVAGPLPAFVDVHGGPTSLDTDGFAAEPAAWVDAGFAVVSVNYRGSEGYGAQWRDALEADVGFTELADIAAVRDALVAQGVLDPARCVLGGGSWGGFLTLLGLGTQPERWAAGVAAVPVADYVAAYEDEMEPLKAFDRSLFGGSPDEVPEAYRRASPLTWIDRVRAPVLVLAGANDPRCPLRQIENYLAALDERGLPHEVYRFDAGHGSVVVAERIRQVRAALDFAQRRLAAVPA